MTELTGYEYWREKLTGKDPDPPEDRTQMPLGFWRMQRGEPLAVWIDADGRRVGLRGFFGATRMLSQIHMEGIAEQGSFGKAVAEEDYRAAFNLGRWPDTDAVVSAQVRPPSPRGSNNPPDDDSPEAIAEQIEAARQQISEYTTIDSDQKAGAAQSLRSRLLELSRKSDKLREKEKAPHFEAAKGVDAKWQPLVKSAKAGADQIANTLSDYMTAKAAAEAKAAREAEKRAEEERRRLERESGLSEAEIDRSQDLLGAILGEPPEPAPVPTPVTRIKGGYGRPGVVKGVKVVTIVDQDKVYATFRDDQGVKELLTRLAQRAVDNGLSVPGVEIAERRKVV